MAYEMKDFTGSLFVNDKKERSSQPDRKGTCKIDGRVYYVSGWVKISKDNQKYMSLAFTESNKQREQKAVAAFEEEQAQAAAPASTPTSKAFADAANRPAEQPFKDTDKHFEPQDLPF